MDIGDIQHEIEALPVEQQAAFLDWLLCGIAPSGTLKSNGISQLADVEKICWERVMHKPATVSRGRGRPSRHAVELSLLRARRVLGIATMLFQGTFRNSLTTSLHCSSVTIPSIPGASAKGQGVDS